MARLAVGFILLIGLGLGPREGMGQNYLAIDKKGISKKRINVGNEFHFKQFGNQVLYNAKIIDIGDTVIYLGPEAMPVMVPLSEIEVVFVRKKWPKEVSLTASFVGAWFLIAGVAEAIADTGNYSAGGTLIIGASLVVVSQLVRLAKWKKYGSGKYRFRILEKY